MERVSVPSPRTSSALLFGKPRAAGVVVVLCVTVARVRLALADKETEEKEKQNTLQAFQIHENGSLACEPRPLVTVLGLRNSLREVESK